MRRRRAALLGRDRSGNTIVEFGFVAPVMMLMLMGLGDALHLAYVKATLDGAIQKAGRDSTIQGGADKAADIDEAIRTVVSTIAKSATWTSTRSNYNSFGVMKPEVIDDKNNNGRLDNKECFQDVNGNKGWDANPSRSGQGGANDVTLYKVTVTYPRMFPIAAFIGLPSTQTISAQTLLKNQPYAKQRNGSVKICLD